MTTTTSRRPGRRLGAAAVTVLAVAPVACGDRPTPFRATADTGAVTHEYVIPAGTAERTARGETVDVVPLRLDVRVGDTLRIRNRDASSQQVGIFELGPRQTVTMRFTRPGELSAACSLHPGATFTIRIHDTT